MSRIKIYHAEYRVDTVIENDYDEDGYYEYPVFTGFVVAWDIDGREYALPASCQQLNVSDDDIRRRYLTDLASKVLAHGSIDEDLWVFRRWTYGSAGWEEQERTNELNDAIINGEPLPR